MIVYSLPDQLASLRDRLLRDSCVALTELSILLIDLAIAEMVHLIPQTHGRGEKVQIGLNRIEETWKNSLTCAKEADGPTLMQILTR